MAKVTTGQYTYVWFHWWRHEVLCTQTKKIAPWVLPLQSTSMKLIGCYECRCTGNCTQKHWGSSKNSLSLLYWICTLMVAPNAFFLQRNSNWRMKEKKEWRKTYSDTAEIDTLRIALCWEHTGLANEFIIVTYCPMVAATCFGPYLFTRSGFCIGVIYFERTWFSKWLIVLQTSMVEADINVHLASILEDSLQGYLLGQTKNCVIMK